MVFSNSDEEASVVIVNCNCGCDEEIHIKKFNDVEINCEEYYLSIHTSNFYARQTGIFKLICRRVKLAFKMLFGKEYLLCDLVLTKNQLASFVKELENICK